MASGRGQILASRIKGVLPPPGDRLAPAGDGTLKGSGRSIQGCICAVMRWEGWIPCLITMIKFGGRMRWRRDCRWKGINSSSFSLTVWRRLVTEWLDPALLQGEVLISDGPLSAAEMMSMEVAQLLQDDARTVGNHVPGTVIRWSFPVCYSSV